MPATKLAPTSAISGICIGKSGKIQLKNHTWASFLSHWGLQIGSS